MGFFQLGKPCLEIEDDGFPPHKHSSTSYSRRDTQQKTKALNSTQNNPEESNSKVEVDNKKIIMFDSLIIPILPQT